MRILLLRDVSRCFYRSLQNIADIIDHRPTLRIASDIYAQNDEKREAAGLPPPRYGNQLGQNQQATDAEVFDRFKKR